MSAEPVDACNDWYVGALIRDDFGNPTWRYRCEPFQRALMLALQEDSELTISMVESLCGWSFGKPGYLTRVLGLRAGTTGRRGKDGKRYKSTVKTISYDNAARIAKALNLDYTMWGDLMYLTDGTHLYELVSEHVVQNFGRTGGHIRTVILRDTVSELTGRVGDLELAALSVVRS